MYKLLLFTLLAVVWMMLQTLQIDEELAIRTLFASKQAVNRAAHAAAQQLDAAALADGIARIDEPAAAAAAMTYLRANLRIDEAGEPLPGSRLREPVEVLALEIVNAEEPFPYIYRNNDFDYEVTLERPGVVLIVRIRNSRTFTMLEPIEWQVKGAAETVY
jgi:hypothetical protein